MYRGDFTYDYKMEANAAWALVTLLHRRLRTLLAFPAASQFVMLRSLLEVDQIMTEASAVDSHGDAWDPSQGTAVPRPPWQKHPDGPPQQPSEEAVVDYLKGELKDPDLPSHKWPLPNYDYFLVAASPSFLEAPAPAPTTIGGFQYQWSGPYSKVACGLASLAAIEQGWAWAICIHLVRRL